MTDTTPDTNPPADRFNFGLVHDVFQVLEAHGYERGSNQAVGHAVGILMGLVKAYEGGEAR
ncbi:MULTISPECIES: hypothetical protein [Streptomyces]|uniref:Uncharacterized protein n=1 Tax=Streptomyces dengpaensis TaxID=2049881 RepID=A0ABM6SW38_9ACTN|nr:MULTISPECIES: hypothetical protein [Streptomyces]AVH58653.1 hypothetical protein C4B68_26055 [Streptomyces dengpaensis]PIB11286.1 hypothetical protein B1C81_05585 [Streptomyces sp. HG99]